MIFWCVGTATLYLSGRAIVQAETCTGSLASTGLVIRWLVETVHKAWQGVSSCAHEGDMVGRGSQGALLHPKGEPALGQVTEEAMPKEGA